MAGHSQFKNIMHRKGAQDAKRAKLFNKIIREITVAARISPDVEANSRLRAALASARVANMPKDNIERALKKALGAGDGVIYEEIRYEGYGPGGVAIIVEALTDNRNRTTADIRSAFSKFGGSLGETGSVSFMFEHIGFIRIPAAGVSFDQVFEKAVEAGAQNVDSLDDVFEVTTEMESFAVVRDILMKSFGETLESKLIWRPLNLIICGEETAPTLVKLIDVLEDNDDIQNLFANFDIPEAVLSKLA